jgi:ATP-binding cassette subfamily B protein
LQDTERPAGAIRNYRLTAHGQNWVAMSDAEITAFMISHRLFVTLMFDRILVLDHGRLVEEGTHQQLMKLDGVYAGMFKT